MKIPIQVIPADIKTVRLQIYKYKSRNAQSTHISIPKDLIERYGLKDKDNIVIAFICKAKQSETDN